MFLVLPLLIPLGTAAFTLVFWRYTFLQRMLSLLGVGALLLMSIFFVREVNSKDILVLQLGNWRAPFGITFVADRLSALMVLLTAISGFTVAIYSVSGIDPKREKFGYHPLFQILLAAVCGSFLTWDLFNLYVWFELILMASFVLLTLGGERLQLESSIKYVVLNLFASMIFLTGVALVYSFVGTLNMADLAVKLGKLGLTYQIVSISMLFLVAFGIKAAVFPFFSWLPTSYHTPPVTITAIFAAILTKVGVYSLIRVFTMIFIQDVNYTHTWILVLAGFTMMTGVLGALVQNELRRLLAFHSVSQMGYMVMGLGLFTVAGLAGSMLFFVHHALVKNALFLISGIVHRFKNTFDIRKLGGLQNALPGLSILFFICAMSSAGVPPFSGFFAKLALMKEGIQTQHYWITGVALVVGLCTLLVMGRVWAEVFWKKPPEPTKLSEVSEQDLLCLYLPVGMLTFFVVIVGFAAGPIYDYVEAAAKQVFYPQEYIQKVFGGMP